MPELLAETLRERRRADLWWLVGIGASVAITVAFYPSVRDSAGLSDYAEELPESLRALFAGGELDLASATGYLNSQLYAMLAPLLLLIYGIGAGANAIAGEEDRGTLDLLLAQPVSRRSLVVQRFGALAVQIAVLAGAITLAVAIAAPLVDLEIGFGALLAAGIANALLALAFATFALALGCLRPRRGRAVGVAAGIAVIAWMLDGFGRAIDWLEPWRPLSPYYQAIGTNPLRDGAQWGHWAVLIGMVAALLVLAIRGLERRDIEQ